MPTLVCPVCGTDNPATRQFCRKCASDLHALAPAPGDAAPPASEPVPVRPIVIGAGVALVLVVVIMGALVLLGGSPAASPSPGATTPATTAAPTPGPTLTPTATPTEAPIATGTPTEAPTVTEEPAPSGSLGPGASLTPSVDSLLGPRRASCTGTNGSAPAGYIHLSWEAVGTTGVRLSIDPPAPNDAYDYGYDDYPAIGSADVPFTCDPPKSDATGDYHLYVVTTQHDKGYFAYRYLKVYVRA